MNPLLIIAPIAAVGAGAIALRAHAVSKANAATAKPIPGGTGSVNIPTSTTGGPPVTNVTISQLPPAIQAALSGPGAPVNQTMLNGLAIALASGSDPTAADPNRVMKATNGLIFDPRASTIMQGLKAGDIIAGDSVSFDTGVAGVQISSIPGGSSIIQATSPSNSDSVTGVFIDPRVPPGNTITIPLNSVTGIAPAP